MLALGPFPRMRRVVEDGHSGRFTIVIMWGGGGESFHGFLFLAVTVPPAGLRAFTGIVDDLKWLFSRAAAAAFG